MHVGVCRCGRGVPVGVRVRGASVGAGLGSRRGKLVVTGGSWLVLCMHNGMRSTRFW